MTEPDQPVTEEERNARVYRLRTVNRLTLVEIAEREGISHQRVSQLLAAMQAKLPPLDLEVLRRQSLDLFDDITRRAYELAEMDGAPLTAGKDGDLVIDPATGVVARDYSGRVAALRLALDTDKEKRKLHGLDAATKVESTATVRYEVTGIDPEQLR